MFFSKESCSYVSGNGNPEKNLYISGNRTFRARKLKKNLLLKCFLYFRKLNFSTSSLKSSSFVLGEPLRVFHHHFFRYFHFTFDFYYCFWVLSLLIVFVHFITVSSGVTFFTTDFNYCFFECFHFINFLHRDWFLCC